nr:hypothetical protein [Bacillus pumilus]
MIEQIWKRKDGSNIHIEVKSSPTIYQNQQAELLLLVDISSRKKFQTVLQKSRERYQSSSSKTPLIRLRSFMIINGCL